MSRLASRLLAGFAVIALVLLLRTEGWLSRSSKAAPPPAASSKAQLMQQLTAAVEAAEEAEASRELLTERLAREYNYRVATLTPPPPSPMPPPPPQADAANGKTGIGDGELFAYQDCLL